MKIAGAIATLVGLLWIFQGLGYVGGSFMTGQMMWFYIGLATAAVGLVMLAWGASRSQV